QLHPRRAFSSRHFAPRCSPLWSSFSWRWPFYWGSSSGISYSTRRRRPMQRALLRRRHETVGSVTISTRSQELFMSWNRPVLYCLTIALSVALGARGDEQDQLKVGVQPDGRIVVPTNQVLKPAGKQVTFPGRPVDLAFTDDGKTLVVKNMKNLVFVDTAAAEIKQTLTSPVGFSVVGLAVVGPRIYVSDAKDHVRVADKKPDGTYQWVQSIELMKPQVGKEAHPAGMALRGKDELWVTSTRGNNVQIIDLKSGQVQQVIKVGVAPYMICFPRPGRAYATNWGGDLPAPGEPHAKSSDSPIRIDPATGIANDGTISILAAEPGRW